MSRTPWLSVDLARGIETADISLHRSPRPKRINHKGGGGEDTSYRPGPGTGIAIAMAVRTVTIVTPSCYETKIEIT